MNTQYSPRVWNWLYFLAWMITLVMMFLLGMYSHWNLSLMFPVLGTLVWLAFISKMTLALVRKLDSSTREDVGLAKVRINFIFVSAFLLTVQFVFVLFTVIRPGGLIGRSVYSSTQNQRIVSK